MKECLKCKEVKDLDCFNKNKSNKDGLTFVCKDCRKKKHSCDYANDKEKYRKKNKKWIENNREKRRSYMRGYGKKYYKDNSKKICDSIKNKKDKNITYKINCNMSASIYNHLKFDGVSKGGRHWETLVGYTKEELMTHLEKLFTDGMNWGNHGRNGWHIDHIIPKSFFDCSDHVEFRMCWRLKNLQPLWEKDNIRKSNKLQPQLAD